MTLLRSSLLAIAVLGFVAFLPDPPLHYPSTRKVDHIDVYFGTRIPDPFRWLEDDTSAATAEWVGQQNRLTFGYLETIPFRKQLRARLEQIYSYPRYSAPTREGEFYVYTKNDGLQNQAVYYIQRGLKGTPEVLIDPNKLSADGTVRLASLQFSKDKKYYAYSISRGGSDWREFFVVDVATRQSLKDYIRWAKFTGATWHGKGFYYSRYPVPADTARALTAKNENHQIYYHELGTDQSNDKLIFEDTANPLRFHSIGITEDERFLLLYITDRGMGKDGNAIYVRDLKKKETGFKPVITSFDKSFEVVDNIGDKLLLVTNKDADNEKVVLVDPDHPEEKNWKTILPEKNEPLQIVQSVGGKLIVGYMKDVADHVYVYDYEGNREREIQTPTLGSVSGFDGEQEDSITFYTFTSFTFPPTIYQYHLRTGLSTEFRSSEVAFVPQDYEVKQVFFSSNDGTRIPMFIVHARGLPLDGNNPTFMYGYGGFNSSMRPNFNPSVIALLEQKIVYAVVNCRGGGEYGEGWHQAGKQLNKQNVFDDFIAAAEWLIENKYTNSSRLAMYGRSNGGLLVGAVMTQRPELFRAAIPAVGVMDMLRYQKFTIGWNWKPDYGSSDDSVQFHYIRKYSPLHNLRKGAEYPATLVTTADHDDRVVPAHSFKFAATLQETQAGPHPVLLRVDIKSGHGASNLTKTLDEVGDIYAFAMYHLGVQPRY